MNQLTVVVILVVALLLAVAAFLYFQRTDEAPQK